MPVSRAFLLFLLVGLATATAKNLSQSLDEDEEVEKMIENNEQNEGVGNRTITFTEYRQTHPIVFEENVQKHCQEVSYDTRWLLEQMKEGYETSKVQNWERKHQECARQMHTAVVEDFRLQLQTLCNGYFMDADYFEKQVSEVLEYCTGMQKNQTLFKEIYATLTGPTIYALGILKMFYDNSTLIGFNKDKFVKAHPNRVIIDQSYEKLRCSDFNHMINATACVYTAPATRLFKNFEGNEHGMLNLPKKDRLKREAVFPLPPLDELHSRKKRSISSYIPNEALIILTTTFGDLDMDRRHKYLIETPDSISFVDGTKCRMNPKNAKSMPSVNGRKILKCSSTLCPSIICSSDAITQRIEIKAERDCLPVYRNAAMLGLFCADMNKSIEYATAGGRSHDETSSDLFAEDQMASMGRLPFRKMTPEFYFADANDNSISSPSISPISGDFLDLPTVLLFVIAALLFGLFVVNLIFVVWRLKARKTAGEYEVENDDARINFVRFSSVAAQNYDDDGY